MNESKEERLTVMTHVNSSPTILAISYINIKMFIAYYKS